MYIDFYVFRSL